VALVRATPTDIVTLRAAVRPVYTDLRRDPKTKSFIRAIEAMKRQSPTPEASQCPRRLPRRERARGELPVREKVKTPVDGTWEMTASRAQVIDVTHSPIASDGDVGHYRLVLRRGRASGFHLDEPKWRSSGVFSVDGDVVRFTWNDGGIAVYRFNAYRDTLTFHFLPGRETGAPNPTFAPWRRVER
jgi:hypothetical protein